MNQQESVPEAKTGEAIRNEAIDRYLQGQSIGQICRELGRSRSWLLQVRRRYQQYGRSGLQEQSRAPHRVPNKTDATIEAAIVRIRQTISTGQEPELRYANIGADSIALELKRLNLKPPHRSTINRILSRHQLIQPRPKKGRGSKLPKDYPHPDGLAANAIHPFDFVSRRIGGSGQRFYGCHLLDLGRRWPYLRVIRTKSAEAVVDFLVAAWQEIGLPAALQIDNDIVWNGGGRGQRVLSTVVRFCLAVGVQVIYIPPYTPKGNAIIESFNDLWNSNFWQRTTFTDLAHLEAELPLFETYCRQRRPLPEFDGLTAHQLKPGFSPSLLPSQLTLHQQKPIPLAQGLIHFIRFVANDGSFSILNETWTLDKNRWAGSTIRATIDTKAQRLYIFHQPPKIDFCLLIDSFDYPLSDNVKPVQPDFLFTRPRIWPLFVSKLKL